jgi:hypothetical protein
MKRDQALKFGAAILEAAGPASTRLRWIGIASFSGILLLIGSALGPPADARKKELGNYNPCPCTCASDKKGQGGVPLYFESVSFTDNALDCLDASGFGGCRIKVGNRYESGTLRNCSYLNPGALTPGKDAGVDPTGGNGPSSPFSRPGIRLNPKP